MLVINTVSFSYKNNTEKIFDNICLSLQPGDRFVLTGKSGIGKSTLFSCIAQLNKNYTGSITFNGVNVQTMSQQERVKALGFVMQEHNLFMHLTILQNCTQPLMLVQGMSYEAAYAKALQMLELLDVKELASSYSYQLSGGQKHRVAIARALCLEPQLLMFDEPTAALDPETTTIIADVLKKLSAQNIIIMVITHDEVFIKALEGQVYSLEDGKIRAFTR